MGGAISRSDADKVKTQVIGFFFDTLG
jgi:hypothetical protein